MGNILKKIVKVRRFFRIFSDFGVKKKSFCGALVIKKLKLKVRNRKHLWNNHSYFKSFLK
jgi:hypothetical protein